MFLEINREDIMDNNTNYQRPLERLSKDPNLEMIEAAIPFINKPFKQSLALYIKMAEINNLRENINDEETLVACGLENTTNRGYEPMLQAMRLVANKNQANKIDSMMKMINMSRMLPTLMNNSGGQSSSQGDMMSTLTELLRKREEPDTMNQSWMNDPRVRKIAPEKLNLLKGFVRDNQKKSPEELIPELVAMSTQLKNKGVSFDKAETELLLDILKESMTPEEQQRVEIIKKVIG